MIHWIFAIIILVAGATASFCRGLRAAILSLWVTGLAIGGLYMTLGTELLAIVQWIVSTVIAISFIFFSVTFGEYGPTRERSRRSGLILIWGALLALAFPVLLWIGMGPIPESVLVMPTEQNDLTSLGRKLVSEDFVSLEVLGLTLLIALIGGGVIARPRKQAEAEARR